MEQLHVQSPCINNDKESSMPLVEALMNRGEFLRQLRLLELADQVERQENEGKVVDEPLQDSIDLLPNAKRILRYDSYLAHQRYYDDLKHVDCHYIDFGNVHGGGRLVMEQEKRLGKGGLCWDAAFILGEHLVAHSKEWTCRNNNETTTSLVELGSGTGLAGLMVAKAVKCHVEITDLPELLSLMKRNVARNFDCNHIGSSGDHVGESNVSMEQSKDETFLREWIYDMKKNESYKDTRNEIEDAKSSVGTVSASVLRWGVKEDYRQRYNVVLGADVVASLYDPIALAETIHALCHDESSAVYVSSKSRLTAPHEQFEERMRQLFEKVECVQPTSRNKNPQVWILKATGKKQ